MAAAVASGGGGVGFGGGRDGGGIPWWWWPSPTWRAGRACHIAVRPPRKCGAETAVSRNTIWQVCVCMQGTKGRDEREEGEDKEEKETNARNTNKHNAIPLPQAAGVR